MVNKKGFMKTIEALIAVLMLIGFLVYILPSGEEEEKATDLEVFMDGVLDTFMYDQYYRVCAIERDLDCLTGFINESISYAYSYKLQFCDGMDCIVPSDLPDENVYVEDRLISSSFEEKNMVLVRLFCWYNF